MDCSFFYLYYILSEGWPIKTSEDQVRLSFTYITSYQRGKVKKKWDNIYIEAEISKVLGGRVILKIY